MSEMTRDDLNKMINYLSLINDRLTEISPAVKDLKEKLAEDDRLYRLISTIQTNVAPENANETSRIAVYLGKLVRKAGAQGS